MFFKLQIFKLGQCHSSNKLFSLQPRHKNALCHPPNCPNWIPFIRQTKRPPFFHSNYADQSSVIVTSFTHHRHRERERAASEDDCSAVVPKRSPLCLHTEITVQSLRSFAWSSTARRSSPPSGLQIRLNRVDFVDPPGSCGLSRSGFFTKRRRDVSSTIYLFYRFFNVSKYIIPAIVRPNELVDVINHIPFWFGWDGVPFPRLDRWMESFYGRLLVFLFMILLFFINFIRTQQFSKRMAIIFCSYMVQNYFSNHRPLQNVRFIFHQ